MCSKVMSFSTISPQSITLDYADYQLSFSNLELARDAHAVIIKMNLLNTGSVEQLISSQYFALAAGHEAAYPHASYLSEPNKQGMLWTWKRLKPGEACTIILRYQHVTYANQYEFKMLYRQRFHSIKYFYLV